MAGYGRHHVPVVFARPSRTDAKSPSHHEPLEPRRGFGRIPYVFTQSHESRLRGSYKTGALRTSSCTCAKPVSWTFDKRLTVSCQYGLAAVYEAKSFIVVSSVV